MVVPTPTLIGAIGVALLLFAFFASIKRILPVPSAAYFALNALGAALACASSYLIGFFPFVVLEGVWAIVALWELLRTVVKR